MKFNFDWNYVAAGAPYITISELALGFNTPSISLLGNPEEVIVGFDDQTMTIGVKQYDGNENAKPYKFYSRMKNGWVRIGCKDFVKYLSSLTGLKFSPTSTVHVTPSTFESRFMEVLTRQAPVPQESMMSPTRPITEAFSISPALSMSIFPSCLA